MITSKRLTIFEGCDGSGKTTAAKAYAQATGARYVHFGPLFNVKSGVARMYVEAMLPALLGYQDVVFDRSWLSEKIYGSVFRAGEDRIGDVGRRMLERLAMRCETLVVYCDPGWGLVKNSFESGREEMLQDTGQLRRVYDMYRVMSTSLSMIMYNYITDRQLQNCTSMDTLSRSMPHSLSAQSAGNLRARIWLVGDVFAERKNDDAWYQWPFASFSQQGCSWWLTEQLEAAGIHENQFCWWNSDMDGLDQHLVTLPPNVIALGKEATFKLAAQNIKFTSFDHPQYQKRFGAGKPYPLINHLKELLNV